MDYSGLPFFKITDTVTNATRQEHYSRHADIMTAQRQELMQTFQTDCFRVSGTAYLLPEFLISAAARNSLIYPQGFLLLEADTDYFTDRSNLESYELRFTLEGEGILDYNGKTYTLSKGEGYFIDCRRHHYYRTSGNRWVSTVLHFNGAPVAPIFNALLQSGSVKFNDSIFPNFEMMQMQLLQEALSVSVHGELKISCWFHVLLTELLTLSAKSASSEKTSSIIEKIVHHMQANFKTNISLDALCREFGISRTHMNRCFRQHTGFSPHDYLIRLRLNNAKLLLKSTDLSVEAVGIQSGFQDTAYFIQAFKKKEGTTPLQYRKSN